ncbi:MAG: hypothetical protein ACYCSN_15625 [Acidobacteriaceae bacterium]
MESLMLFQPGFPVIESESMPRATLCVLISETGAMPVSFHDTRSNKTFTGPLGAGRAALLLVGEKGELLASYGWQGNQ